jgi:uncharacterized membrane protein (UPF0127 family)
VRYVSAANDARGAMLGTRIAVADRWWQRLRGLAARGPLAQGEGLLLRPCRAVHMFGMRHPIDVAFVARDGRVVATYSRLGPGRRTRWHGGARDALELPPGTLERSGTREGDAISYGDPIALSPEAAA